MRYNIVKSLGFLLEERKLYSLIISMLALLFINGCGEDNDPSGIKITALKIDTNGFNRVNVEGKFTNTGHADLHNLSYEITSNLGEFSGFGQSGINLMSGENYKDVHYAQDQDMYYQPGTYTVTLTVKNEKGRSLASETKSFTILDPKTLPIAVEITDLSVETDGHSFITFKGAFFNHGGVDLYGLEWELSSNYPEPVGAEGSGIDLHMGQTYKDIVSTLNSSLQPGNYEVTLAVKLGDTEHTILVQQTETFTIK